MRSQVLALCLFEGFKMIVEADAAQPPVAQPAAVPPATQPVDAPQPLGGDTGAPIGVDGAPLTVESMVDRLNVIRGGKSFSDPEVFGRMTTLWKSLSSEIKINLDKILTEIGKVVINSPNASEPQVMEQPQPSQAQQPPMSQGQPQPQSAPPAQTPLQEAFELMLLEKKNKDQIILIDGKEVMFGSDDHVADLERTLSGLDRVRNCFARGSANRHRYSQALGHLKKLVQTLKPNDTDQ